MPLLSVLLARSLFLLPPPLLLPPLPLLLLVKEANSNLNGRSEGRGRGALKSSAPNTRGSQFISPTCILPAPPMFNDSVRYHGMIR